ncbi:acyl-CoA thioesterase [Tissierella sp. MSJ-40]|uniref:Acyl-CoA thioesterase n=1 Tax=Tissierella simiarum TaxID=2841534 RepID=A0ABS6E806_9FIRM|nr:hotdog domain-containing protein [Tissierella simiarum]MBU5438986.1 acyl-CoA thioesterase [Tissierella simiarum]
METIKVSRLVKSEDLNHHGTLFAGRMAEWFIESCFICGAKATEKPENIVCVNVHGLTFKTPGNKGDIINLESRIAKAGKSSFMVYGKITKNNSEEILSDGFITFVFVDENGKTIPHNIVLNDPIDEEDMKIRKRAESLR